MSEAVGRARAEFERQLAEARQSVSAEFGGAPRLALWFVPLAAAAAGFALALRRRRRRRLTRPSGA